MPVAFEILGKRCEIGERLVDLNGVSRPRSSAPPPRNLLPGKEAISSACRDAKRRAISAQPYRLLSV